MAVGRVAPGDLDAVTLDAYGTLVELDDHVERLREALARAGVEAEAAEIARAFETEVAFYTERKCGAGDERSLAALRHDCARVFTSALGVELDFTDAFTAAIRLRPLPGVTEALADLRSRGLALAVVSNWDCSLGRRLAWAGLRVDTVVTCAEAGVAKPSGQIFRIALARLGVSPDRALHVGDQPEDEAGAAAAGLHFAPAPLASLVAEWP
jgi:HAD superfamily hydrolase (TIGR01509 family)